MLRIPQIIYGILTFKDNSFDVIYAHLSLQYFNDAITTKIFDKLYRMLRPKGLLFVKCKSVKDKLYGKGRKVEEDVYVKSHLRHFFSKEYMLFQLGKFKVVRVRYSSSKYHSCVSGFVEGVGVKV